MNVMVTHHVTGCRVCALQFTHWGRKSWAMSMVAGCDSLRIKTAGATGQCPNIIAVHHMRGTPRVWHSFSVWLRGWMGESCGAVMVMFCKWCHNPSFIGYNTAWWKRGCTLFSPHHVTGLLILCVCVCCILF
jgi:hypothetical protein